MTVAKSLIGAVLSASYVAGTAIAQEAQEGIAPANTESTDAAGSVGTAWTFGGEAYFWGASIGGTSAAGDDIDIPFSDILDNLNIGLMTLVVARKNKRCRCSRT
jgi:hypothetical protein